MKRYNDYMDGVEVSDTLHEKLKNLEEPKKKSRPWVKWGSMAAAFALIVGAGAWGLSRFVRNDGLGETVDLPAIGTVGAGREDMPVPGAEIADIPAPDIAIVGPMSPPDDSDAPADRTNGGYEIVDGEMAAYFFLPALDWVDASALPQSSRDYSLAPPGAIDREATWDDVQIFAGGEKAMADHLLWDYHDWSGTISFLEDGTPCAALLYAKGDGMIFTLEVMLDYYIPSSVALPVEYYLTSRWQGTQITTVKGGGSAIIDGVYDAIALNERREVSFTYNGAGYKLTLYAANADWADEMCARFVRYAVDGGFHLYALSDEPIYEEDMPYEDGGAPNWEDINSFRPDCPYCADGTAHTHPYNPGYVEPFPAVPDAAPQITPYDPNVTAEAKTPTPPN